MPKGDHMKKDREELARDIRGLARMLGEAPTQREYVELGKHGTGAVRGEWGKWSTAKEELGLNVHFNPDKARVTVECANCGVEVEKKPSEVENVEYSYCSQDCVNEHKKKRYSGDGNPRSTLVEVKCANCGDGLQLPRWRREQGGSDRYFCDHQCQGEWRHENYSGENNPQWQEYPTNTCEFCGKPYKIVPANQERSRFCSKRCLYSWQAVEFAGDGSPRWKERKTLTCRNCGVEFTAPPHEQDSREYCSYDCMHEMAHPTGEDHPLWNPDSGDLYYGPNWPEERRAAIIRDRGRCQMDGCHRTEQDQLRLLGSGIDVHHITPLREFKNGDVINHDEANKLSNLIVLCRWCHISVEHGSYSL